VVFADKSSLTPQFHRFMADDLDLLTAGTHLEKGFDLLLLIVRRASCSVCGHVSAVFNVHELRHETLQQLWECVHKKRDKLRKGFQELAIDEARAKRTPVRRSSQTIGSSDDESSDGSDAMETRKPSRNQGQGRVSRLGWSKVMCRVMGFRSMPWLLLQPYMVHLGSDGKIDYHRFLARYEIKLNSQFVETWDEILLNEFCRRIYRKTKELVTIFSYSPKNPPPNTQNSCTLITAPRVFLLPSLPVSRELDMNGNGQLDLSVHHSRWGCSPPPYVSPLHHDHVSVCGVHIAGVRCGHGALWDGPKRSTDNGFVPCPGYQQYRLHLFPGARCSTPTE